MGKINELSSLVKELEEQLNVCIRCGSCQAACPLFEQTRKEADVARGKLALLSGLMTDLFQNPAGVNQRLNKCLLCGSCAANCPSGVNALEIFIRARAIITEYQGLPLAKKLVFRGMLSNPKLFNTLMGWASKFQGLFVKSNKDTQGTSCSRISSPLLQDRHFLPMAKKPFNRTIQNLNQEPSNTGPRVLFFTGCIIDKMMPQIATACVKALTHNNVRIIIPENQGCCGIPALASGDYKSFKNLVNFHADLFELESFDYLVTACATCTSTIKKLWPALYQASGRKRKNLKPRLEQLSNKTMDINEFLIDVIRVKPLSRTGEPVTYHDPCHLKKSLGIHVQPRQLLNNSGHPVTAMAAADKCCGMGGSFNLIHYDISSKIGKLKADNIIDTECSTVASGCPACMMQISDMLSKAGADIKVKHPVQMYADSLD